MRKEVMAIAAGNKKIRNGWTKFFVLTQLVRNGYQFIRWFSDQM